jgi:hypothetical protein
MTESRAKKRARFLAAEDEKLRILVKKYGENAWSLIAAELPGRNIRQCRERWKHYLSGRISKDFWEPDESRLLFEKMRSIGPRWTQLAQFFPGRTDIQIKHYWMQNFAHLTDLHLQNRIKTPPEFRAVIDVPIMPVAMIPPAPPPLPHSVPIPEPEPAPPVQAPSPPAAPDPEQDLFRISRESSMDSRSFADLLNLPE